MQIAIVSRTGSILDTYTRFFSVYGADLIHAPSLSELYQKLPDALISGFVVEIHMMIKATETEKELLHTMMEIFPSVKTNWNPEAGFRALYNDSDKSGEENLRAFVRDCRNFKPRALRKKKRHEKTFNVLFWSVDASPETAQRAFTLDVSTGGLFVGTCDSPREDSLVWVVLQEVDARPVKVLVKWRLPWGAAMRVPGFGGSFVDLDAGLAEKLETVLTERRSDIR
ncbi:MAG: hypothetical protein IH628_05825 [Proteobacteria bacterium]|nr:hypothetical protein [Pseudomonadota bacterium]